MQYFITGLSLEKEVNLRKNSISKRFEKCNLKFIFYLKKNEKIT